MAPKDKSAIGIASKGRPGVSGSIIVMLYRKFVQLALEPRARFEPGWTTCNTLGTVIIRSQGPKSFKIRDDSERIYWHASSPEDDRVIQSIKKKTHKKKSRCATGGR